MPEITEQQAKKIYFQVQQVRSIDSALKVLNNSDAPIKSVVIDKKEYLNFGETGLETEVRAVLIDLLTAKRATIKYTSED